MAAERVLADFAGRKISILNDQSPAAVSLTDRFRERLAADGVAPVVDGAFKPGLKNYSDLALRLRDAGTEIVYIGGSYVEAGLIIRALRDVGSNARLISSDAIVTDDFRKQAGEAAEGALMTFPFDAQNYDAARDVLERFRAADVNAEGYTLYAYAAVQTWVSAAQATGGTDSARIANWLRAGNRVRTVIGEIAFNAKGDLRNPRFAWFRWEGGAYVDEAISQ